MEQKKINIVVTDDHKLFRKGIKALLSDFDFVKETYEAGNGIELLELLKETKPQPDVVLLDLRMPGMDGIEVTPKIKELYPELKIIILTMEDDEQFILHMINEGVNGYLLKNADPDELEIALVKVMEKDFYFSDDISTLVFRNFKNKRKYNSSLLPHLSHRESQVLELICKEFTAAEIADKLGLSVRTIEGFRRKLLDKTGTKNMAGLVVYALKNNLVLL